MTASPSLPGLSPARLHRLMEQTIKATRLDLAGLTVLTEAASGAYGVTAVVAAMANAKRVHAVSRSTRYGTVEEVTDWTMKLAGCAGVQDRITVCESVPQNALSDVDIVTNSGHVRPINAALIDRLPSRAVIGLMFEAWEFRPQDIDVAACRRRNIPVVGVNERHEAVDVFSYLGPLCVRLLHDAGLSVYRNRIALLCDNEFDMPIKRGLAGLGADVHLFSSVKALPADCWDAVAVALKPGSEPRIGTREAEHIASATPPGCLVAQFWGEMDRDALAKHDLTVWPPAPPAEGHMAILLSALGPDSIVRLQTGGLKAAEVVFRNGPTTNDSIAQVLDLSKL